MRMKSPRLTKLELQIMEALWTNGASSVREIHESFPEKDRPAYTTIQTTIYRMEGKKAVRCVKRIGNANSFGRAFPERTRNHDGTSIAIHCVCRSGRTPGGRVPEAPGRHPLLDMARGVSEISDSFCRPDRARYSYTMAGCHADCAASFRDIRAGRQPSVRGTTIPDG